MAAVLGNAPGAPVNLVKSNNPVYRRRLLGHRVGIAMSVFAMVIGLGFLGWILTTLLVNGFGALSGSLFSLDTPAPGSAGGLRNAIFGSVMMVGLSTLVSTPIGILAGMYLAEYGANNKFAAVTRFVTDIMLSAPSIVIGLFVYALYVARVQHFSGYAGTIALSLIAIPVVVRTTDNMLHLVPNSLLEAAFALGAPRWKVAMTVRLRAVKAGVVTGVLLALARIAGETAPLLFTALNNQFFSTDLDQPTANLPVVIYKFAMSPYDDWQAIAWGGALLVTFSVLLLNILSRTAFRQKNPQ
jgi:phosphate transport system permease protein